MSKFNEQYGPWAIVTGSSAGIGLEFAQQLAARGLNLVLVARRADLLEQLAEKLEREHSIATRCVPLDLTTAGFLPQLQRATADLDVGLLVNNAGTGELGLFLEAELEEQIRTLDLNVRAPLVLTHAYGRAMAERGRGGILIVSSMVAKAGVPRFANYAATKAYDMILAEGLNHEFKAHGVDVLGLLPGFTHSETMSRMDTSRLPMPIAAPDRVVRKALDSLGRKVLVVPGFVPKTMNTMMGLMPRRLNTAMMAMTMGRIEWKQAPAPGSSVEAQAVPSASLG